MGAEYLCNFNDSIRFRCDECGRFIPYADIEAGAARHHMTLPDSDRSIETWETLCRKHSPTPQHSEGLSK